MRNEEASIIQFKKMTSPSRYACWRITFILFIADNFVYNTLAVTL